MKRIRICYLCRKPIYIFDLACSHYPGPDRAYSNFSCHFACREMVLRFLTLPKTFPRWGLSYERCDVLYAVFAAAYGMTLEDVL